MKSGLDIIDGIIKKSTILSRIKYWMIKKLTGDSIVILNATLHLSKEIVIPAGRKCILINNKFIWEEK